MKAAIFGGAGKPIAIESVPDPVPGRDQVVVKVGLCGICGTDMHMTEKHESGQAFLPPAGASLGHEFCGEVVALGTGVKRLTIGDRISAMPIVGCGVCAACLSGHPFACTQMQTLYGGFGEYALVNANFSVPLPKALSLVAQV